MACANRREKTEVTALPPRPSQLGWTLFGAGVLAAVLATAAGLAMVTGGGHPRLGEAVRCAAAVCLVGSCGGWLIARWPIATPALGVAQSLGAVTLRIFLPLITLGWLQTEGSRLREAGAAQFLLNFYLLLLVTDILLHIIGSRFESRIGNSNQSGNGGKKTLN